MKKITFCILLLLTLFQSQGQVLIGNGTELQPLPINSYYGYSYSQTIYTAAEINATGNITTISWYYGGPAGNNIPNSQDLKVFLGHTTKNTFSSSSDWEVASNLTEVYTGGITVNGPGWASVTFTTPFNYNGTDNLIVATAELQSGYDNSGDYFLSHQVADSRSMIYQNDGTPPNLETPQDGNTQNYVPNIIFGGIAKACPTPFFLNTVMTTSSSAMVVWGNSAQGPGDSSQYYISESNTAPTASTEPSGNSTMFAMPAGLEPDTVYYIWVRNVCNNIPAEWSYPTSFRTECNPATTINENFDTTTAGALPACWTSIVRGEGVNTGALVTTFDGEAYTGTNSVRLFNSNTPNTVDIILVSPKLSNLAANTHRLRFYADANDMNELIVGTLNNNSNTATFTPLPTVGTVAITDNYAQYTVDFTGYTGTDSFIGIKLNSSVPYNPASLDNIRWEATAACTDVAQITVEDAQPESATISWSSTDATGWEIVYDEISGTTDPTLITPIVTSTSTTKELIGLSTNTLYNVWVRSTCEAGIGAWIGPIAFRTACNPIAEFTENFDTTTVPNLTTCWNTIVRGASEGQSSVNIQTYGFGSNSAPNAVLMTPGSYITLDTENDVILVSPNLSTVATGTHRLKFFAKGNANLQVGTLNDISNTANFTSLQDITIDTDYQEYTVDFSGYEGMDTYFGFRVNAVATFGNIYIDNITWELTPLCPDVTELVLEGVSPNSATISWTEGGIESAWEIVYGAPTTTDPSTLSPILASDASTKEITGLEENTSYIAWVRSDCGTDKGAWIGPIAFKTDCLPTTTIDENFDSVATPSLPACWTSIIRGVVASPSTAFVKSSTSNAHTPSNSIEFYNSNQTSESDVILVSPNLGNLGAGTHRLRFYSSYYYPSSIEVGTLDTNDSNAVFTVIDNIGINATYSEYIVDFTQWSGITDKYIGIRLSANGVNSYAHIDDFVWEVAPACPDVETVDVLDITTNDAYVIWEMGELEASNWQVSYAPSTITDASTGTISDLLDVQEYALSELTSDTEYNVWVRSVCGDLNGNWVGPITFRSKCNPGNSLNENFDSTPNTALPACWSKIIRGDSNAEFFAYIINSALGANSGTNNITMFNSSNNADQNDIILVSPPMDNLAAGTHQLSFYLKGNTANIQVGTLDDNQADIAVFTSLTTVTATPTYTKYTIDFSGYSGTNTYIGIRHGGTSNTSINIDDVVWEPIPQTCATVTTVDENFDTTPVETIPECWTAILRGPTSDTSIDAIAVKTSMIDLISQPNAINIFKGLSGATDEQILVLPQLSNLSAGTHKLSFYHAGPPVQIEVGTLSDNTDTAVFTLKEAIDVTSSWTQATVDFTNYTGTNTYIGLRLNSGEFPFVSMFIDNVIWSPALGTGEFNNEAFAYYPNPVKNILNLSYEQNITNVAVYNLLGQEIITKKFNANQTQIDMSGFASGTYIVKVTSENKTKAIKIVKE